MLNFAYALTFNRNLENTGTSIITAFNNATTQEDKIKEVKIFTFNSSIIESNITCNSLSYNASSKVALFNYDYKKKTIIPRAEDGTLEYEETNFTNQTITRGLSQLLELFKWSNTLDIATWCAHGYSGTWQEFSDVFHQGNAIQIWRDTEYRKGTDDGNISNIFNQLRNWA